jgi:uncharacterized Rmd1/YagE family protein
MAHAPYETWRRVGVRAILVGGRLDLRSLYRSGSYSGIPLAIAAGERGMAVLFRYGVVVLYNLQLVEEGAFLNYLRPFVGEPLDRREEEEAVVLVDPDGEERVDTSGVIHVRSVTEERLALIADVLAKSVVLAFDENRVASAFDRIEPVAADLRRAGFRGLSLRYLLDHLSDVLLTQHRMVGRVRISDKPDLLWDHPELERLYARLTEEYELSERDSAMSRKLALISQTAETAVGLLQARSSLRVEWYIVILIIVEIVLTIYELFLS